MEKPWKYTVKLKTFTHYGRIGSLFLNYFSQTPLNSIQEQKRPKCQENA
jgi:hypothetical protein